MRFFSPAKINMHLDIGVLREDGYHDICSWFLMVGLFDVIDINTQADLPEIIVEGNHEVPPLEDIIYKAASNFYEEIGITAPSRLIRRFPSAPDSAADRVTRRPCFTPLTRCMTIFLPLRDCRDLQTGWEAMCRFFWALPLPSSPGEGNVWSG